MAGSRAFVEKVSLGGSTQPGGRQGALPKPKFPQSCRSERIGEQNLMAALAEQPKPIASRGTAAPPRIPDNRNAEVRMALVGLYESVKQESDSILQIGSCSGANLCKLEVCKYVQLRLSM